MSTTARKLAVHGGLFAATCATTTLAINWQFSATLMTILLCHEMGHYVVARRHGVAASLPYFIPMPPGITLGTMGAIIRMDRPIADRNKLIDVGAAGPLAGLAVAFPLLWVGLSLSTVGPGGGEGTVIEGNSLAYLAVKYAVTGRVLPAPDGTDVMLHPVAFAAWVGLLITMINLIPIGQLDGGHIACAYLGSRHERLSRRLHWALLAVGACVVAWQGHVAAAAGLPPGEAVSYGVQAGLPWLVWALLLYGMRRLQGGIYHPPVGQRPLTPGRRRLVWFMWFVFVSIFTPVPLRQALP
ncbi:MAG: site-2 protease family protein [Deltaproteobacteria bacterium]|nr:MAG: site-2 protease family protein [Deltaproteobacteria bacterium]